MSRCAGGRTRCREGSRGRAPGTRRRRWARLTSARASGFTGGRSHRALDPRGDDSVAASASSPTSRAASRTRSSRTRSPSCSTSNIAARSAPTRAPATAPAFWCRSRTSSSSSEGGRARLQAAQPANTRSAICSCRAIRMAADHPRHLRREGDRARAWPLLGWREVPTDNSTLGLGQADRAGAHAGVHRAAASQDRRGRVRAPALHPAQVDLERDLSPRERRLSGYYPVSLSCRTVVYKGMFLADQLGTYYPDLHDRASRPARSRWCTSASRPTPSRPGRWRIPTG